MRSSLPQQLSQRSLPLRWEKREAPERTIQGEAAQLHNSR